MDHPASGELIEARVRKGLAARLLTLQQTTQWIHLVALAALLVLLWGRIPGRLLLAWAGVVILLGLGRVALTRWALRRQPPFEQMRQGFRLAFTATGLAWGLGAAALMPHLSPPDAILVLAVFATFVAGAITTLGPDPPAFRLYVFSLVTPYLTAILVAGRDRLYLVSVSLATLFTVFAGAMNRRAHQALVEYLRSAAALREALDNVKTLRGLLPICASCKKIRDDLGYWSQIEVYVSDHSDADFTHGICPDCMRRLYPDVAAEGHP